MRSRILPTTSEPTNRPNGQGMSMFYSIKDGDRFWQCGQWVRTIDDATKYTTAEEANKVFLLRNGIPNSAFVVPNHTPFRKRVREEVAA